MAFWEGIIAGFGIAIPVGAVAILIVETGLRGGFKLGFMAGAGAATADVIYATLAVLAGAALTAILAPYATQLRLMSGIVLVVVGVYGIARSKRDSRIQVASERYNSANQHFRIYGQFLAITLLNPLTLAYFGALILGANDNTTSSQIDHLAFVLGAGLASLSWQTLLAGSGSLARQYMSPQIQRFLSIFGNVIVILLGIRILLKVIPQ